MYPVLYCARMHDRRENKVFFATLGLASDVTLQSTKENIGEDAVSVVIADGTIYIPFAELVDIDKEIERLKKTVT